MDLPDGKSAQAKLRLKQREYALVELLHGQPSCRLANREDGIYAELETRLPDETNVRSVCVELKAKGAIELSHTGSGCNLIWWAQLTQEGQRTLYEDERFVGRRKKANLPE